MAGRLFRATLESKVPSQQKIINKEMLRKEKEIFDKALNELDQLLDNSQFDGFPVEVFKVMCDEDDLPWNDYGCAKKFLDCPLKSIHEYNTSKCFSIDILTRSFFLNVLTKRAVLIGRPRN